LQYYHIVQYVAAQGSLSTYTDKNTGITYQAYLSPVNGGIQFGMALPTNPTNEFIGLLVSKNPWMTVHVKAWSKPPILGRTYGTKW
jgi:hypothetical protein